MTQARHGQFVWYENFPSTTGKAIEFYTQLLGWRTEPFGDQYVMWVGSQGPLGGVMQLPEKAAQMGAAPHWMGHVQVNDVDGSAALAQQLGGKLYHGPEDIPTVGRFAVIADPQGAVLSLFAPAKGMELHDASKHGEVCWRELLSSDAKSAFEFYSRLFGWKTVHEMDMGPMGSYRIFGGEDQPMGEGGMMNLLPGVPFPPHWLYYFNVDDLDATIARAQSAGAKLVNGPEPIPTGARIAQLVDPQGAVFALHAMPKR